MSFTGVAIAEIGDRTQLLALILAARFKRPWPIIGGVACATVANHAAAAWIGVWCGRLLRATMLDAAVGVSMILMALWTLKPDVPPEEGLPATRRGVFAAAFIAFFLAEIGDKTQIATLALAAAYGKPWLVIAGTSSGMLAANVPVIFFGSALAERLPLRAIRYAAALLFACVGALFLRRAAGVG